MEEYFPITETLELNWVALQMINRNDDETARADSIKFVRWSQGYVNPAFYIFVRPELDYLTWDLIYIRRGLTHSGVAFPIF